MKKILFLHPSAQTLFYSQDRDDCNVPYIELRLAFEQKGYKFHFEVEGDLLDYSFIFCVDLFDNSLWGHLKRIIKQDLNYRILKRSIALGLEKKIVILLSESLVIAPFNYKSANHKGISTIFTWQKQMVDNIKYFHFYLPVRYPSAYKQNIEFDEKKLVMNISGNKFSSAKGELYSFRRHTIKELNTNFPNDFDLYGVGWDNNGIIVNLKRFLKYRQFDFTNYRTYRGAPLNKSSVIGGYKFNICYENARFDDYITEKIFDIFINESVPVFYGAPNIADYIPQNTFIHRDQFETDAELMCYLAKVRRDEHEEYLNNISIFLGSEEFKNFDAKYFIRNIMKTVGI